MVCGRCGGSGKFSHNAFDGDTCYGCRGKKNVFTKRGLATTKYLDTLRSVRADQIVVGMTIHTGSAFFNKFCLVTGISTNLDGTVRIEMGDEYTIGNTSADKVFVVKQTKEEGARTLALAIAFQSTLDDQGNVDHDLLASIERSAASEDRSLGY